MLYQATSNQTLLMYNGSCRGIFNRFRNGASQIQFYFWTSLVDAKQTNDTVSCWINSLAVLNNATSKNCPFKPVIHKFLQCQGMINLWPVHWKNNEKINNNKKYQHIDVTEYWEVPWSRHQWQSSTLKLAGTLSFLGGTLLRVCLLTLNDL